MKNKNTQKDYSYCNEICNEWRRDVRRQIYTLLLCLCVCLNTLHGQETTYNKVDNVILGLANTVTCFLQDDLGMMWIGSDKGLFSYDGYSSRPHFEFGTPSNARIYCGLVVDQVHLYLGTDKGMLLYNYKEDRYEELLVEFPKFIQTMTLQGRKLWLGTLEGLYTYDIDTKVLSKFVSHPSGELPHQSIYAILRTLDDQVYVGTYNGLCKYIPSSNSFQLIPLPINRYRNNQFVNAIQEDRNRKCIWIGTEGCLYKMNPVDRTVEQIEYFHGNSIKSLAIDGNGNLLVATDNGLYVYNEAQSPLHFFHDSRNAHSLPSNVVWTIFSDCNQNIWLGTGYGIAISRFNKTIDYIPISQITGAGEGNHFFSVYKDSRDYYWLGGTNGLLRTKNLKGNLPETLWYKMGDVTYPIGHSRIRHIYEDKNQQLWIATDASIYRYDYDRRQFVQYNIVDKTRRYNSNWAYYIAEDKKGKLWIASCMGGIFVVDKQQLMNSGKETIVAEYNYSTENGLSGMFVNQIFPDKEGNMWVLLYNNGINKINTRTHEVTKYPIPPSIGDKNPNIMHLDEKGLIWLAFRGGVVRINPQNNDYRTFNFDSFENTGVLCMFEADSKIWLCTTDGLWEVDQKSLVIRRINLINGRFFSVYYDKTEKEILLGGFDEIAFTTPQKLLADENGGDIMVTSLYINNKLTQLQGKSIRYIETLNLSYKQNNLSFELSDLPYSLEEKNTFVYQLEGVDPHPNVLPSGSNKLSYNNLQPGDYRLVVSKLGDEGKSEEVSYTLDVCVAPPWYYTFWAKSIYILLFISLVIWGINFFRVKNRLKLERLEKEKIMEQSKQKIDFYSNLSHDLKTPLSLIIAPLSKLLPEIKSQQEKKILEGVQRNAIKLNALIHQLLDFNRIDNTSNTLLILSRVEFISFARNILTMFDGGGDGKKLNYILSTELEKIYLDIDVVKWESILTNLLSNATKYTPDGGSITLSIVRQDKELLISVSDTGVGISQADIPYVFQRFFQASHTKGKKEGSGVGLYLVKTYAELHGGSAYLTSTKNEGTVVSVTLPNIKDQLVDEEKSVEVAGNVNKSHPLVLIVDDSPEMIDCIKDILGGRYQYQTASNGKEGLEFCLKKYPDMIITDLMMPVMDGMSMCQHIKEQLPMATIPIIMLTAKSDKMTELESIQKNIDVFLAKPFEPTILLSRVEQLLTSKKTVEAKTRLEIITDPKAIEAISIDEKFLLDVTHMIEDRIDDSNLNVNAICELMGISNKQMYRKIKLLTGLTPVEYIRSIRIKKAAMLLSKQTFTVSEVMYMVGFSNASYFSRCFQNEFGETPKQYMSKK